jgi:hypothetical protein
MIHGYKIYSILFYSILFYSMLRPVLAWRAVWNLCTVYFFSFPIFFFGPRQTADSESVYTGARLYIEQAVVDSRQRLVFQLGLISKRVCYVILGMICTWVLCETETGYLSENIVQSTTLVNTIMNFLIPQNARNILTSWASVRVRTCRVDHSSLSAHSNAFHSSLIIQRRTYRVGDPSSSFVDEAKFSSSYGCAAFKRGSWIF